MLWIGEVGDAESNDDLITSSSITGTPIPDFENLDFKIASGLRKNQTGNFPTAEVKAQSEQRSLTGGQIAVNIYEFFKTSGDNEAILDFRDLSNVQLKNDNVQASDTKWDKVLSAVTDRPTDSMMESLFKMQVEKSEELKYLLQVYAQQTTYGNNKYDYFRLKFMARRHLDQKSKYSSKPRNRDEDRLATGAPTQGKAKRKCKDNAKNNSERGDCIRWTNKRQCSFGEISAHSNMNQKKGKGKGRSRSRSPTGSPHRNSKGDGKGSDDGSAEGTPNFIGKSPSGKANTLLCTNFKKGSCQSGNS